MVQPIIRICTRCGLELPLEQFSNDRSRADGLSKWCKKCVSENSRRHYQANREKILTRTAERRSEDPEHFRAINRASEARRDPEIKRAYNKRRYEEKRDEILSKSKARHRLKRYGVTVEQFEALLQAQGGGCGICRSEVTDWHIDHDHSCCPTVYTCGKCLRGIFCRACNIGLGNFRDDPELLERAIRYLQGK
jgi:hypothetical protein